MTQVIVLALLAAYATSEVISPNNELENLSVKLTEVEYRIRLVTGLLHLDCPKFFETHKHERRALYEKEPLKLRLEIEQRLYGHLVEALVKCRWSEQFRGIFGYRTAKPVPPTTTMTTTTTTTTPKPKPTRNTAPTIGSLCFPAKDKTGEIPLSCLMLYIHLTQ